MKTRIFMVMAAAALVLAACRNDEETDNWAGEIRLSSGLTVQAESRSVETNLQATQIADGVHVGFFINEDVAGTPATTYTQNLNYEATGKGGFDGTTVYFPQSNNGVNIYAYAPWKEKLVLNNSYDFTVESDQSEAENYIASDLLWGQPMKQKQGSNPATYEPANPVARTKENVNVTFKHLLSKVQVTLEPGDGLTAVDFKGATLSILGTKPTTSLTLKTGDISTASGEATPIIAAKYPTNVPPTSLTASAIVVPQTIAKGTQFMQVHLASGGDLFYTIPDGELDLALTLESGKIYKYEIKVNLSGLTVTSTIADWETIGEGDPVEGTATME